MAKALKKKKNLSKQFKQITLDLVEKAQESLGRRSIPKRGEGVHNARKQFKQVRGVLRMVRYGLGHKIYKKQNVVFRDAGRPLSEVRDADVMIETFDDLIKHFESQVKKGSFKKIRSRLLKRRTKIRKQVLEKERAMGKVSGVVKRMEKKIDMWPSFPDRFGVLQRGISRIYARGQDEMKVALSDPSVENLHMWRKSVKYLRYQLEILERLWIPIVSEMAKQAKALSDNLGLDHDLAVLDDLIQNELNDVIEPVEYEVFTALIKQRRSELLEEAKKIGPRLYAEAPKQFSQRLKGYWKTWRSTGQAA